MPNPTKPNLLPLFPLSSHVLPQGRMALRLFEPRYLRMVRESMRAGHGFVMCMSNPRAGRQIVNMHPIATLVDVIDFNTLDDGLLGVTVEGAQRVRIDAVEMQPDGLRIGAIEQLPDWPARPLTASDRPVASLLAELLAQHRALARLYPSPRLDDASWICMRWLELLPIAAADKQALLTAPDCELALRFVAQTLELTSS